MHQKEKKCLGVINLHVLHEKGLSLYFVILTSQNDKICDMLINSFTVSFHQDKKKNASLDTNVENKTVVSSRGAKKLNQLKLSQHFVFNFSYGVRISYRRLGEELMKLIQLYQHKFERYT